MKSLFLFSVFIVCCFSAVAQELNSINMGQVNVSYNNTTHIIFSADIEYFSTVDKFVSADQPEKSVKNILRIKANVIDFKENTTLTVALVDGRFYSWTLIYKDELKKSVYYAEDMKQPDSETIYVDENAFIHLVAPDKITYVDIGDPDNIIAGLADNTSNIVKVIARENNFPDSNISFATQGGDFYSYNIQYGVPLNYSYRIGSKANKVIISGTQLSGTLKDSVNVKIKNIKQNIYSIGNRSNKISVMLTNILVYSDYIIFKVLIDNDSNIDYDIDNVQFFITDKKTSKKAINQEKQLYPLFFDTAIREVTVAGKKRFNFYALLDKFSIGNDKILCIRLMEKGSERNIEMRITNKSIINAKKIN